MQDKLHKVVPRVMYEMNMFSETVTRLIQERYESQFQKNVLIETCLIHARNLRDFACRRRSDKGVQDNDVLAADFVDSDRWQAPPMPKYLRQNQTRLNRSLAHLSYDRVEYESNKGWDFAQINREVSELWQGFTEGLSLDRREWFLRR